MDWGRKGRLLRFKNRWPSSTGCWVQLTSSSETSKLKPGSETYTYRSRAPFPRILILVPSSATSETVILQSSPTLIPVTIIKRTAIEIAANRRELFIGSCLTPVNTVTTSERERHRGSRLLRGSSSCQQSKGSLAQFNLTARRKNVRRQAKRRRTVEMESFRCSNR